MSQIVFKNIQKIYPGATTPTINNANLTIEDGEFCVFVGPSGCGKSTLLRMVAGLEDISSGDLSISGVRVNDMAPAQRGVAMVFQSYALYPHMTVGENMAFGLKVLGSDAADIKRRVDQAAEVLQLTPLMDRLPKELSGGQRQRVAIGRAIVKEPKVFLFDEPLSNLDAALRVQTRIEIAKLHKRINTASMIYVTHDQVEAMTLADKIVLLHTGKLVQERGSVAQVGSPLTLYNRPQSRFVAEFIGSPKMNVLPAKVSSASSTGLAIQVGGNTLNAAVDASGLKGQDVFIGIRPEHVVLLPEGSSTGDNRVSGRIEYLEKLGDATLLYVELATGLPSITVRLEGTHSLSIGREVQFLIPAEHVHAFGTDDMALPRLGDLPS
ncbi:ABC transporter ATP-binding protein [Amphibiibacter pelophylacis]|uniref:Sn-glycerol-3-phosphate ABC transporter ATP-binding protein UgpC n=1 Tax=Amphibiibacter pelophylacis TaxID=1799477 RepID=A0ACC6NY31_9BURK